MSTTILTDEQKAQFVTDIANYGTGFVAPLFAVVESIEQAVLQSPEVQARMEAYAAAKVRDALEEAAEIADRNNDFSTYDAIRALIPPQQ
ncbi:hypothetical protein G5B41_17605 [bacterium SGD-2]|nr:hypothetical protein [bacterium SGD-2]